ncbi:MAG TPA: AMP-binding protein, partial [Candidatus Sulfotelmatobacter sp.]|nr:AMP-binding protein [Candidatus Sulfotelmatobacter sp.]
MLQFPNLVAALEAAPEKAPFVTFWIDEDERETLSFGEFRDRARVQAAALQEANVIPGDRVVILMPQGVEAMTTFAAALMLGAVPAFLAYPNFKVEPSKYQSGLSGVTGNLRAKAVIIDRNFPKDMMGCVALGDGTKVIRAGAPRSTDPVKSFSTNSAAVRSETVAFIQHSAGTTGLQKGVALTHGAVLRQIGHLAGALKIERSRDRIYSWLPLYHDMGLIACFMLPMVCHVPIVMQSPIDWVMQPESLLQVISDSRCTLAWMPNFAFQFVPRRTPQRRWAEYDLSSLRLLINCSEPVRAGSMSEFQKAFGLESNVLQSSYAMAENVFAVTQSDIATGPKTIHVDAEPFRASHRIVTVAEHTPGALAFTSSGGLLPMQQIRILADSGEIAAADIVGEIAIQSDCLFQGYYNRPDLTADAFVDGWYRTGDLGFLLNGELYIVGRKKDLLIVGGENIYPQDIEEIVAAHPAIHDGRAVAMGIYNPELGTQGVVIVAEVERPELLNDAAE